MFYNEGEIIHPIENVPFIVNDEITNYIKHNMIGFDKPTKTLNRIKLFSENREKDRDQISELLKNSDEFLYKIKLISGSSFGGIVVYKKSDTEKQLIELIFKEPYKKGVTGNTIRATITEVVPAIMIKKDISPRLDPLGIYERVKYYLSNPDNEIESIFLNNSELSKAKRDVDLAESVGKLNDKIKNAIGCYRYIKDYFPKLKEIKWAASSKKPYGIKSSKGDIFIKNNDNRIIQLSLKSKLRETSRVHVDNATVNKLFDFFKEESKKDDIYKQCQVVYDDFLEQHIDLSSERMWDKNKDKVDDILHNTDLKEKIASYDDSYKRLKNITRNYILQNFLNNPNSIRYFIEYFMLPNLTDIIQIDLIGIDYKISTETSRIMSILKDSSASLKAIPASSNSGGFYIKITNRTGKMELLLFNVRDKGSRGLLRGPMMDLLYNGLDNSKRK